MIRPSTARPTVLLLANSCQGMAAPVGPTPSVPSWSQGIDASPVTSTALSALRNAGHPGIELIELRRLSASA